MKSTGQSKLSLERGSSPEAFSLHRLYQAATGVETLCRLRSTEFTKSHNQDRYDRQGRPRLPVGSNDE